MAEYFEYFPVGGGSSIIFGNNSDYILRNFTGTGSTLVNQQTQKAPFQIGKSYLNANVNPRVVTIDVRFKDNSLTEINTLKNDLSKKLVAEPISEIGAADLGILRYHREGHDTLELPAVPIDSPQFTQVTRRGNVYDADIEFFCPNPYWREISDTSVQFQSAGGLTFPLEFAIEIESYDLQTEVDNQGDVSTPFSLRVFGEIDTFRIINNTTGKELEIIGLINSGDFIEVNTEFGNKSVIYEDSGGTRISVFDRVTIEQSDFWQLQKGINDITFETNENNGGYAVLFFRQRFGGI